MIRTVRVITILISLLPLSGCLFRSHRVEPRMSTMALHEATLEELVQRINAEAAQIQTLNATVDITPVVGGAKKGKVTEYTDISGYVLVRKPSMLRMIGLFPIVRNRAFDMVSNGKTFELSIPTKNKFFVGRNDVVLPSQQQPLESIRPQVILDALLLRPIDPQNEIAVLEAGNESVVDPKSKKQVEQSDYILNVIQKQPDGDWLLSRKVIFNRGNLEPDRQIIYDKSGNVVTDARYENYTNYSGVMFPAKIEINRTQEEYSILLDVVKVKFNEPLKDNQFVLQQPPGSQLVRLDLPAGEHTEAPAPAKKKLKSVGDNNRSSGNQVDGSGSCEGSPENY